MPQIGTGVTPNNTSLFRRTAEGVPELNYASIQQIGSPVATASQFAYIDKFDEANSRILVGDSTGAYVLEWNGSTLVQVGNKYTSLNFANNASKIAKCSSNRAWAITSDDILRLLEFDGTDFTEIATLSLAGQNPYPSIEYVQDNEMLISNNSVIQGYVYNETAIVPLDNPIDSGHANYENIISITPTRFISANTGADDFNIVDKVGSTWSETAAISFTSLGMTALSGVFHGEYLGNNQFIHWADTANNVAIFEIDGNTINKTSPNISITGPSSWPRSMARINENLIAVYSWSDQDIRVLQSVKSSDVLNVVYAGQSLMEQVTLEFSGAGNSQFLTTAGLYFTEVNTIQGATGGSAASFDVKPSNFWWNPNNETKGTAFDNFDNAVAAASVDPEQIDFILWDQGQTDATDGGLNDAVITKQQYKDVVKRIFKEMRLTVPNARIILVEPASKQSASVDDVGWQLFREATREIIEEVDYVLPAPSMIDASMVDSVHPDQAGYELRMTRLAETCAYYENKGGLTDVIFGPQISNITAINSTRTIFADINHFGGATMDVATISEANFRGWRVEVNGSPVNVAYTSSINSDRVELTLEDHFIAETDTITVTYPYGKADNVFETNVVQDDNSRPIRTFYDQAVVQSATTFETVASLDNLQYWYDGDSAVLDTNSIVETLTDKSSAAQNAVQTTPGQGPIQVFDNDIGKNVLRALSVTDAQTKIMTTNLNGNANFPSTITLVTKILNNNQGSPWGFSGNSRLIARVDRWEYRRDSSPSNVAFDLVTPLAEYAVITMRFTDIDQLELFINGSFAQTFSLDPQNSMNAASTLFFADADCDIAEIFSEGSVLTNEEIINIHAKLIEQYKFKDIIAPTVTVNAPVTDDKSLNTAFNAGTDHAFVVDFVIPNTTFEAGSPETIFFYGTNFNNYIWLRRRSDFASNSLECILRPSASTEYDIFLPDEMQYETRLMRIGFTYNESDNTSELYFNGRRFAFQTGIPNILTSGATGLWLNSGFGADLDSSAATQLRYYDRRMSRAEMEALTDVTLDIHNLNYNDNPTGISIVGLGQSQMSGAEDPVNKSIMPEVANGRLKKINTNGLYEDFDESWYDPDGQNPVLDYNAIEFSLYAAGYMGRVGNDVAAAQTEIVTVACAAQSGTKIASDWAGARTDLNFSPTAIGYMTCSAWETIRQAHAISNTVFLVHDQGQGDALDGLSEEDYETQLEAQLDFFDYYYPNMHHFIVGFNAYNSNSGITEVNWDAINKARQDVATARINCTFIDVSDIVIVNPDGLHYLNANQEIVGARVATAINTHIAG